jgi:hypothetical protein
VSSVVAYSGVPAVGKIYITLDNSFNATNLPAVSAFSVTTGGVSNAVSSVSANDSVLTLTLTNAFSAGNVGLTYTSPSNSSSIQDIAGNSLPSFTRSFIADDVGTATTVYPSVQPKPLILQGNAAVDHWVITTSETTPAHGGFAASTLSTTQSVMQDSSGGNISFDINPQGSYPGETVNVTAQGYNGANSLVVTSGQLGLTPGFFNSTTATNFNSSVNIKFISLASDGTVTGLPPTFSSGTIYLLTGATDVGNSVQDTPYSLSTLTSALQSNQVFSQYFAAHQILLLNLAIESVRAMGYNSQNPLITINGTSVPLMRSNGNWGGIAMEATNAGTVKIWTSTDGGAYSAWSTQTLSTNSGDSFLNAATQFNAGSFGVTNSVNSSSSNASLTKVYFTDNSGNAVAGLKFSNLPVDGGILTSSNWITAPSLYSTALSVYSGTVAQILASKTTAPAGSFYYINDTIEHIQAAGAQLYTLEVNNQIIGATPTNGFAAIAIDQRVVRDSEGDTRAQRQGGIERGQPKRAHGGERLDDACRRCGRYISRKRWSGLRWFSWRNCPVPLPFTSAPHHWRCCTLSGKLAPIAPLSAPVTSPRPSQGR